LDVERANEKLANANLAKMPVGLTVPGLRHTCASRPGGEQRRPKARMWPDSRAL
jgi:hypothetical protein